MSAPTLTNQVEIVPGPDAESLTIRVDSALKPEDVAAVLAAVRDSASSATRHVVTALEDHAPLDACEVEAFRTLSLELARAGLDVEVRTPSHSARLLLGLAGVHATAPTTR